MPREMLHIHCNHNIITWLVFFDQIDRGMGGAAIESVFVTKKDKFCIRYI